MELTEDQAADIMLKLAVPKTLIRNKIQDATLCEMREMVSIIFSDLSAEEEIHEDDIANLKTEIERSKTTNSMLRSGLAEAKSSIEALQLEERQESLLEGCDETYIKFDEQISSLEALLLYLKNVYCMVDKERAVFEDNKKPLSIHLDAKAEEFRAFMADETEWEKKLGSCRKAVEVLKDEIAEIGREKPKKEAEKKRIVNQQNKWEKSNGDRIEIKRGEYVELVATVKDNVGVLMGMLEF